MHRHAKQLQRTGLSRSSIDDVLRTKFTRLLLETCSSSGSVSVSALNSMIVVKCMESADYVHVQLKAECSGCIYVLLSVFACARATNFVLVNPGYLFVVPPVM